MKWFEKKICNSSLLVKVIMAVLKVFCKISLLFFCYLTWGGECSTYYEGSSQTSEHPFFKNTGRNTSYFRNPDNSILKAMIRQRYIKRVFGEEKAWEYYLQRVQVDIVERNVLGKFANRTLMRAKKSAARFQKDVNGQHAKPGMESEEILETIKMYVLMHIDWKDAFTFLKLLYKNKDQALTFLSNWIVEKNFLKQEFINLIPIIMGDKKSESGVSRDRLLDFLEEHLIALFLVKDITKLKNSKISRLSQYEIMHISSFKTRQGGFFTQNQLMPSLEDIYADSKKHQKTSKGKQLFSPGKVRKLGRTNRKLKKVYGPLPYFPKEMVKYLRQDVLIDLGEAIVLLSDKIEEFSSVQLNSLKPGQMILLMPYLKETGRSEDFSLGKMGELADVFFVSDKRVVEELSDFSHQLNEILAKKINEGDYQGRLAPYHYTSFVIPLLNPDIFIKELFKEFHPHQMHSLTNRQLTDLEDDLKDWLYRSRHLLLREQRLILENTEQVKTNIAENRRRKTSSTSEQEVFLEEQVTRVSSQVPLKNTTVPILHGKEITNWTGREVMNNIPDMELEWSAFLTGKQLKPDLNNIYKKNLYNEPSGSDENRISGLFSPELIRSLNKTHKARSYYGPLPHLPKEFIEHLTLEALVHLGESIILLSDRVEAFTEEHVLGLKDFQIRILLKHVKPQGKEYLLSLRGDEKVGQNDNDISSPEVFENREDVSIEETDKIYQIDISRQARKTLDHLLKGNERQYQAILNQLEQMKNNPYQFALRKLSYSTRKKRNQNLLKKGVSYYKKSIGHWTVILEISDSLITVHSIERRA